MRVSSSRPLLSLRAIVPIALLLLLAISIAGCGSSPDSGTKAQSTSTSQEHVGGEASIEEFGSEASGAERKAIEGSFHSYLSALAGKDYPTACSHLSADVKRSLEQLVAKDPSVGSSCAAILPVLLSPQAPTTAEEQARGKIVKVRSDGSRGFVVFHAPGAKLYQQTMDEEGGQWKLATVAASVLVPEL